MEYQDRLREIFNEEKNRLNLDNENIQLRLERCKYSIAIKKKSEDAHIIGVSKDDQRDEKIFRRASKHELYHVYKRDCCLPTIYPLLYPFLEFWIETRARVYEFYSIRL